MSARATSRAGFGPSISGSAAVTAIPIPSTSPTGSTARPTGCSAPYSRTGTARRTSRSTAVLPKGSRGQRALEEVPPSPRPARPDVPERDCDQPLAGISDLGRDDWEGRNVAQIIGESLNPELNIFARLLARFGDVKHADHPPVSAVGDMPVGARRRAFRCRPMRSSSTATECRWRLSITTRRRSAR